MGDVDIWARLQDLFTKIPVDAIQEQQFHFAIAQYWIFFALAYIGLALVLGNKVGKYINLVYVGLISFFIFSPQDTDNGIIYWLVFALGYLAYGLIHDRTKVRSAYLLFFSLFFYWRVGAPFLYILIFSTIVDFFLGKAVYNAQTKFKKKLFIAISMVTNLSMLAYFKYFKFIAVEWNALITSKDLPDFMYITHPKENAIGLWLNGQFDANMFLESLPMVVGISFYTFQTMSYSIDIYRGHIKPLKNIIDFGFFVSFFPQLVAGPIVRASEFVPQIHQKFELSKDDFGWSIYMIMKGLIKKMIFADFLAVYFLDHVFQTPGDYSGMAQVLAIFGYSLQIYGDFSGYTDMAIGIAKLMGFQLPKNFNSPYKAIHCGEFWKRWHITLSSWLKDYLYIPLGGNRGGTVGSYVVAGLIIAGVLYAVGDSDVTIIVLAIIATIAVFSWYLRTFFNHINRNINITLTMLLGGLWHGASWQFVIWGGLNGVGVLATKYWLRFKNSNKVIAALVVGAVFLTVRYATDNPIWMIAVWWALVIAAISGIKALYDLTGKQKWRFYYVNAIYGMIHTLFFITFTRIYFRGETMEKIDTLYNQIWYDFGQLFKSTATGWSFNEQWLFASDKTKDFLDYSWVVFAVMLLGYIVHWVPNTYKSRIQKGFVKSNIGLQMVIVVLVAVLCYQAYSADAPAFIYFQF